MSPLNRRQFIQQAAAGVGTAAAIPYLQNSAIGQTTHIETQNQQKLLPLGPNSGLPIQFGAEKNVFCDWWFIDAGYGLATGEERQKQTHEGPMFMPHGVRLSVARPFLSEEPIIVGDKPADGQATGGYCTLMQDGGKYRLWYESYLPGEITDTEVRICYAESDDGYHWKKPDLGLFDLGGSKSNNIVFSHGHGATIFIDPAAKSAERYKMVYLDKVPPQIVNGVRLQAFVFGATSPDGIHWTHLQEPLLKHMSDTQSVIQYDSVTGKYVAYLRGWESGRRMVVRTESSEFGNFAPLTPVLSLGPQDPPDADIYTNAYQRWPGAANAHIMLPAIFRRSSDYFDLQFAVSRDGVRWQFPQREPLIPHGPEGSGYEGMITAGQGTVTIGKGMWAFPITHHYKTHNMNVAKPASWEKHSGSIWLAKLREDSYISLEAEDDGECWTQPATFNGSQLLINSWGMGGARVAIEIAEVSGAPVPGFALTDCDCLYGEQLWSPMTWRGKSDISALRGKVVRFRFSLNRVRLHAFRFA